MTLGAKEKIKIENYKAQFNSMVGSIQDANKELENILTDIERAEEQKSALLVSLEKLQSEVQEKSQESVEIDVRNKVEIDNHKRQIENLEGELKVLKENKTNVVQELAEKRGELTTEVEHLAEKKVLLSKEVEEVESVLEDIRPKIDAHISTKNELEKEVYALIGDIDEYRKKQTDLTREKEAQLKEVSSKLDEERERIGKPLQYLAQREQEIERKYIKIKIMANRLQNYLDKHLPGMKVKL